MIFRVVTLFPDMITNYTNQSILLRAQEKKLFSLQTLFLRDFAHDARKTVDDTPYGGGAGMVMKPEPIYEALASIDALPMRAASPLTKIARIFRASSRKKKKTILLSPRGTVFTQRMAEELSQYDELVFVCGRYEGVDQRVVDHMVDEEVSIGPYVLAGGELGALVIIEAVARLLPGVLGNPDSLSEETFGNAIASEELVSDNEYPQYTKPSEFLGWEVPAVLRGGNHREVAQWRAAHRVKSDQLDERIG